MLSGNMRRMAVWLVAFASMTVTAGCATIEGKAVEPGAETVEDAIIDAGLAWQQESLANGPVGIVQYEKGVERLRGCLSIHGVELINEGWDPIGQLRMLLYYRDSGAGMSGEEVADISDRCRKASLNLIEQEFQRSRQPRMSAKLHTDMKTCLIAKGVPAAKVSVDPREIDRAVEKETTWSCLQASIAKLYPNITAIYFP